jgi:ketosteroid isomerase-like protein
MSENVDKVERAIEGFNRRDIDAVLAMCHPEIEWTPPDNLPGSRTYHGREGVREAVADMVGVFGDLQAEPVRLIAQGNSVVGLYIWRGHAGGSGVSIDPFEVEVGFVCRFAGGLATSIRFWDGFAPALEAAGVQSEIEL